MELKQVKRQLGQVVQYQGTSYFFSGCTIRRKKTGAFYYQAELSSLHANSVLVCELEKVEVVEE